MWSNQIKKKEDWQKKKNMSFSLDCANQFLMFAKNKKELNICLSFKFNFQSSNYFKTIKLNFTLLNWALIKWQDIFSTSSDRYIQT